MLKQIKSTYKKEENEKSRYIVVRRIHNRETFEHNDLIRIYSFKNSICLCNVGFFCFLTNGVDVLTFSFDVQFNKKKVRLIQRDIFIIWCFKYMCVSEKEIKSNKERNDRKR